MAVSNCLHLDGQSRGLTVPLWHLRQDTAGTAKVAIDTIRHLVV